MFTRRIGSDLTPPHAFTFPPPYQRELKGVIEFNSSSSKWPPQSPDYSDLLRVRNFTFPLLAKGVKSGATLVGFKNGLSKALLWSSILTNFLCLLLIFSHHIPLLV